jgi:integrase
MRKVFIPFLRKRRIASFADITPPVITAFQNHLLSKGAKPQTVNKYSSVVRSVFDQLVMDGTVTENVFDRVTALKEKAYRHPRGCHELPLLKGVFNRRWENELSYLLCLTIYATGLRNSEIDLIKYEDITAIHGCRFIDVKQSKTANGVRLVPLHPYVYKRLEAWYTKKRLSPCDYLLAPDCGHNQSTTYNAANAALGERLGVTEADLARQYITFYSGRYYWKTLMNAAELGDVEEYFMGHKVSRDVAKQYNRLDKRGQDLLVKKAREVFRILDEWLFCKKSA